MFPYQDIIQGIEQLMAQEIPFLLRLSEEQVSNRRNHQQRTVKMLVGTSSTLRPTTTGGSCACNTHPAADIRYPTPRWACSSSPTTRRTTTSGCNCKTISTKTGKRSCNCSYTTTAIYATSSAPSTPPNARTLGSTTRATALRSTTWCTATLRTCNCTSNKYTN